MGGKYAPTVIIDVYENVILKLIILSANPARRVRKFTLGGAPLGTEPSCVGCWRQTGVKEEVHHGRWQSTEALGWKY